MLRVLVFVTLIAWTRANDDFINFCKDELNGTVTKENDKVFTCEKELPVLNVRAELAERSCQHWSRFAVDTATMNNNKLTCKWKATGTCQDGRYIYGYCHKILGSCSGDWKLLPWNDRLALRWVVLTEAKGYEVAKVRIPAKYTKPTVRYSWGRLLPLADDEERIELAVVLHRMPVFGGHPGDLVYVQEGGTEQDVYSICRKQAFNDYQLREVVSPNLGGATGGDLVKHGSGATGSLRIKSTDDKFTLHLSRNTYSPRLNSNGKIDLNYFHDVCETICDGCFAATPDYLDNNKLKEKLSKGKFWLPGGREPKLSAPTGCGAVTRQATQEMNAFKVLHHKKHLEQTGFLKAILWKTNQANNICSDQGRNAVAFQDGKVIDVPIFDRLPLVCVRGDNPRVPDNISNCNKNSESDGKGGCKCKKDFVDIRDSVLDDRKPQEIKNYVATLKDKQGYVCVKVTCTETQVESVPYESILFVIDGSSSINEYNPGNFGKMQKFMRDAKAWLPRICRIYMAQFGWHPNEYPKGQTPAGWTDAHYDKVVNDAVGRYVGGWTPTYLAMRDVQNWWILGSNPNPRRAIMFVITDGKAADVELRDQERVIDQVSFDSTPLIARWGGIGSVSLWKSKKQFSYSTSLNISISNGVTYFRLRCKDS